MIDISFTMVLQWLNFGLFLYILYIILVKPLTAFLDKRAADIQHNIDDAADKNSKAAAMITHYEQRLKSVEAEADQFMENVRRDALSEKQKILTEAQEQSASMLRATKREIEFELENARTELRREVARLSVACAQKIVEREMKQEDHERLINEFLQNEMK